jgi:biopolymer transport protein ExbD
MKRALWIVFAVATMGCKRIGADAQPAPSASTVAVKNIDLPRAASFDDMVVPMLSVEIHADGTLAVNGEAVPDERAVTARALDARAKSPDLRAVIRADRTVAYERVIRVMDALKRGGISQMAFAVDVGK